MSAPAPLAASAGIDQVPFYAKVFAWAFLAGSGGAVKFVSASLKSKTSMSPRRFLLLLGANVFISGFSGLMGALLFSTFSTDHVWQLIASGIFGYLGTQGLDVVALAMNKRIGDGGMLPVSSVIPIP